jgi:hypothetical protein
MNGYQPKMRCDSCTKKNDCKKYKDGKEACKKYEGVQPKPPTAYTPPAFRKPIPAPAPNPTKQRTVLSVRDFAILLSIAHREIDRLHHDFVYSFFDKTDEEKQNKIDRHMKELQSNPYYQDLLRIRDKLGELNIEIETPSVEVEE